MVLVTDPGTYNAVYWPLLHAEWNGWTPTDMIFPGFLFAVGIAITLSFASRLQRGQSRARLVRHVIVRSLVIIAIGLAINGFPDYDLHTIRIPGVLQRIGLCYLLGALLYLSLYRASDNGIARSRSVAVASIAAILLALYWALLELVPVPGFGAGHLDSLRNLAAYLDRSLFGIRHLWPWGLTEGYGVTFDPEGMLSTLGALASLLIGVVAGDYLRSDGPRKRKAVTLAIAGLVLLLAGWLMGPLLPINKKLWTSTFTLFSGGMSLVVFAGLYAVLDIKRWRWWTPPVLVFGSNAMLAFVLSNVITTLSDRIHVHTAKGWLTLHNAAYQYGFATWLQPVHASLAYAMSIVSLNLLLLYPLYRKRIFLRV
jgi:predicted acyltransferase